MPVITPHHSDRPIMHPVEARHRARELARAAGHHTFQWTPCPKGHTTYSVKSGTCDTCRIQKTRNTKPTRPTFEPATKQAVKALQIVAERNLVTQ